jgi:nuclear pore complex protein Nup93
VGGRLFSPSVGPAPTLSASLLSVLQEQAFPRVQRDILQVEQYSQKLRSRAARADATAESLDASRLLAHEGLNPRKLTQALQTFELRPTYEDVFTVETATVEEYLQQVGAAPPELLGLHVLHCLYWLLAECLPAVSAPWSALPPLSMPFAAPCDCSASRCTR